MTVLNEKIQRTRREAAEYERLRQAAEDLPRLEAEQAERERLAALREQLEAAEADLAGRAERFRLNLHRNNTRLTGCLRELANILAERRNLDGASLYHQAKAVTSLQWQANGGKLHKYNVAEVQTLVEGQAQQLLIDAGAWPPDAAYHPPGDVDVGAVIEGLDSLPIRLPAREPAWAEIVGHNGEVIKERIA